MKKIKIMLFSFALLVIIGGALAFKVKNTKGYCTATIESDGTCLINEVRKVCPNGHIQLTTAQQGSRWTWCYTTPLAGRTDCKQNDGTTDLLCTTTPTSFRHEDPQ